MLRVNHNRLKLILITIAGMFSFVLFSSFSPAGEKTNSSSKIIEIKNDGVSRVLSENGEIIKVNNSNKIKRNEIKFGGIAAAGANYEQLSSLQADNYERGCKLCVNDNLQQTNHSNVQTLICEIH